MNAPPSFTAKYIDVKIGKINHARDRFTLFGETDLYREITVLFYKSGSAVDRVDYPCPLFGEPFERIILLLLPTGPRRRETARSARRR